MSRPTYTISGDGQSITCLDCGLTSWNPNDVREQYCGNCHEFHSDKEVRARMREQLASHDTQERHN